MKIGDLPAFLLCVIRVVSYFTYCLDTRIDSEYTRDNAFSESNRKRDCVNCEAGIYDGSKIMFTTRELQDEIIRLKKEKDVCILAHAYQSHDIWEVADYVGDSYGLSKQAAQATNKIGRAHV